MSKDDQVLRFLEKLDNKIDRLDSRLDAVEKIQIKQEGNLGEHMRRTAQNEEGLDLLRTEMKSEIKPLKTHVDYMNGALKFLGIIATLVAVAAGVVKIIEFFVK